MGTDLAFVAFGLSGFSFKEGVAVSKSEVCIRTHPEMMFWNRLRKAISTAVFHLRLTYKVVIKSAFIFTLKVFKCN